MIAVLGHFASLEQYSKAGWVPLGFKMRILCSQKLISNCMHRRTKSVGEYADGNACSISIHALDMQGCVEALSAQFAADAGAGGAANKQKSNHENFKKAAKAPTDPPFTLQTEVAD